MRAALDVERLECVGCVIIEAGFVKANDDGTRITGIDP